MLSKMQLADQVTNKLSAFLIVLANPLVTGNEPDMLQFVQAGRERSPNGVFARPTDKEVTGWTLGEILLALRAVETGGTESDGRQATGDGGHAIGPFQIHHAYWQDSRVPGAYEDCRDLAYASEVVVSYWWRHCPTALESLDAEVLARVHNGGPEGNQRECTKLFWRRVQSELMKQRTQGLREGIPPGKLSG